MSISQKKSGGAKKFGRNEKKCAQYKAEKRREKNKLKRIARYFMKDAEQYAEMHGIYSAFRALK